jgi:hypothetical protein
MWQTILDAARSLGSDKGRSFSRAEIIRLARDLDSSHHEMAYNAMFQTMVIEAPTPAGEDELHPAGMMSVNGRRRTD